MFHRRAFSMTRCEENMPADRSIGTLKKHADGMFF